DVRGPRLRSDRAVLFLGLVFLSACFNPDDILPVKGTITSPDAVEGQVVKLLRESRIEGNQTCANATAFKETTVNADGTYAFDIFRAQAQKLTGFGQFCFRLETTFASGSSAFTDFELQSELQVPTIPDWRPQASLVDGVVRFTPVTNLSVEEGRTEVLIHRERFVTQDGGVAWERDDRLFDFMSQEPVSALFELPEVAFEDFSGELEFRARLTVTPEVMGPFGDDRSKLIEFRAGQTIPFTGTRTPFSRGLACPPFAAPCPLTDGALTRTPGNAATRVVFFLPAPTPVSTIVLRGVETGVPLMGVLLGDADGGLVGQVQHELPTSTWSQFPEFVPVEGDGGVPEFRLMLPAAYSTIRLDGGVVSAVVLTFPQGLDAISEVSLFE
ncbi:MAG TPA: hypothetical protein VGE37_09305, partial [Archangium sp.]